MPETEYARGEDGLIAYQVFGEGPSGPGIGRRFDGPLSSYLGSGLSEGPRGE